MIIKNIACLAIGATVGVTFVKSQEPKTLTVQDFPDLVSGLKQTPGCLDVKTGALDNGKQLTVFAWFKNKAAVQAWYASPMHRDAMKKFFPNTPARSKTLTGFDDDKSPLLVVATVTPSSKPMIKGSPLAVSQIAIEIYTPVPGGVAFGGSLGPKNLPVPGMVRID